MKYILPILMLLPLSGYAMEKGDKPTVLISLTRDGEGDRQSGDLSDGKEEKSFDMFSRDLKNHYKYIVSVSLLKLQNGQATIKGSVGKQQISVKEKSARAIIFAETETIRIREQTIPVNERRVIPLTHDSDINFPATLGLVVLVNPNAPQAKL